MSETKFTPGPWRVGKAVNGCWIEAGDKVAISVGRTFYQSVGHREEEANAHLISAAPELYAAAAMAAPHGDRLQHGPNVSISAAAYRALCAALSKARGQS